MEESDRQAAPASGRDGEISVTRARQAVSPHIVRWVLGVSLVLAVLALGLTWAFEGF